MNTTPRTAWLLLPLLTGCWIDTQRHPAPMLAEQGELPPGSSGQFAAGPEEVIITRLADPVFVRRPQEASSFPLYHYRNQERLNAGGWVFSGAGGRVEILYPGGTSLTMLGRGAGVVGSESRGEPLFFLQEVDRAVLHLGQDEQVRLLGGAVLTANGGPVALELLEDDVLRVLNRSLGTCWVAYREEVLQLDPADVVDLPLLDGGTGPLASPEGFKRLRVGEDGLPVDLRGEVDASVEPGATRLRATGDHEVLALGLRLRLDPGDEVVLSSLDGPKDPQPK